MNIFWKGAAALLIAGSAMTAVAAPAQAQSYRDNGWRGDRHDRWDRHDRRDRHDRGDRWDRRDRREWRGDHYRRGYAHGYGRRCWTDWRYDHYRHRDVRVRVCR